MHHSAAAVSSNEYTFFIICYFTLRIKSKLLFIITASWITSLSATDQVSLCFLPTAPILHHLVLGKGQKTAAKTVTVAF